MARHLAGLIHLGQHGLVDVQDLQQLIAPAAVGHIQQLHAGGIRDLGGIVAGQHEADIILGQQDVAALGVHIGLVVTHPQDLGQGEAGQGGVGGDGDQLFLADLLVDFVAFLGGTLVAPDDGGTQDFVVLIQHDQAMHLTGNAQGHHIVLVHAGLHQHGLDGLDSSVPPVLGVLLRPAVVGLVHGILDSGRGHRHAILIEQHRFGAGGAKVDTQNVFHMERLLSYRSHNETDFLPYDTWKMSIRQGDAQGVRISEQKTKGGH